jgi:hypothetical protein
VTTLAKTLPEVKTYPELLALLAQLAFRKWCEMAGHGYSHGYALLEQGEVDSIVRSGRRYIIVQSWLDYLERQRLGLERDPAEKLRAQQEYQRSAQGIGGQIAARARAKIGQSQNKEPAPNSRRTGSGVQGAPHAAHSRQVQLEEV